MGKFLNPFTNFGFKRLFGSEENQDILINFLNEILPDKKIAELAKLNSQDRKNYKNSLKYYRDVKNSLDMAFAKGV